FRDRRLMGSSLLHAHVLAWNIHTISRALTSLCRGAWRAQRGTPAVLVEGRDRVLARRVAWCHGGATDARALVLLARLSGGDGGLARRRARGGVWANRAVRLAGPRG